MDIVKQPYSSDLNLIENARVIIKKELKVRKFTTITSLKNELFKFYCQLEQNVIKEINQNIYSKYKFDNVANFDEILGNIGLLFTIQKPKLFN